MNIYVRTLIAAPILAACVAQGDGETPASVSEELVAGTILQIASVVDRGSNNGYHRVELYGTFPAKYPSTSTCASATVWAYQDPSTCYAAEVKCNGALVRSQIDYYSRGQINVAFSERPTGSICTFKVKEYDSQGTGPVASNEIWYGSANAPTPISPPPLEILNAVDRGLSAGYHYYELYGYFPASSYAQFAAFVWCDGVQRAAGVSGGSIPGQVNILFAESSTAPASCTFELKRTTDNARTLIWNQSVNGPRAQFSSPRIGAYAWGGVQPPSNASGDAARYGVRSLRQAGLRGPIRLAIDSRQRAYPSSNVYNLNVTTCPRAAVNAPPESIAAYLACAAGSAAYQNAFNEAGSAAPIILTTMDAASQGDWGERASYLDDGWQVIYRQRVYNEYKELARVLYTSQTGKGGRTFVVANWEGDNLLYCGAPSAYLHGRPVDCGSTLPPHSTDFGTETDALRRWFQTRHDAIVDAAAEYGAGSPDVHVYDGIEFNSYNFIHDCEGQLPCPVTAPPYDVLHSIIPVVKPAYALYSAWETTEHGRVDEDLAGLATYLNGLPVPPIKVLGEFGQDGANGPTLGFLTVHPPDPTIGANVLKPWRFRENIRGALRNVASPGGFSYIVTWAGFPTEDSESALLSTEGADFYSMRQLRAADQGVAGSPTGTLKIAAVAELPRNPGRRFFQLYGVYPTSSSETYIPSIRCDGDVWKEAGTAIAPAGQAPLQVNVSIPDNLSEQWCIFRLRGPSSGFVTNEIGPIRSCQGDPCPRF
jgi:hypothetical protein